MISRLTLRKLLPGCLLLGTSAAFPAMAAADGTAATSAVNTSAASNSVATSSAAATSAAAPDSTPSASRLRRLLEPHSGLEFRLDRRWQPVDADTTTGINFRLDGKAESGEMQLRFPIHFTDPPADADAAYELDLQQATDHPDSAPKGLKWIDNPAPLATVGAGLQLTQHTGRFELHKQRYVLRRYYLTTPESRVAAVSCTLPESALGPDDPCQTFLRSSALMDSRDRADRLSLLENQEQRDPNTDRFKVSCATINKEVTDWRTSNPTARLEQLPRFASLYSELLVKVYVGGNNRAIAEASQSAAAYIGRIAETCKSRPEATYGDAVESSK